MDMIEQLKQAINQIEKLGPYSGQKSQLEDLKIDLHNAQVEFEEKVMGLPRIGY